MLKWLAEDRANPLDTQFKLALPRAPPGAQARQVVETHGMSTAGPRCFSMIVLPVDAASVAGSRWPAELLPTIKLQLMHHVRPSVDKSEPQNHILNTQNVFVFADGDHACLQSPRLVSRRIPRTPRWMLFACAPPKSRRTPMQLPPSLPPSWSAATRAHRPSQTALRATSRHVLHLQLF